MFSAFLSEVYRILLLSFRYFIVAVLVSLAMMSIVTGEFPPPVGKMFASIQAIRPALNFNEAVANMKTAQKRRDEVLRNIEVGEAQFKQQLQDQAQRQIQTQALSQDQEMSQTQEQVPTVAADVPSDETQLKIKRLEYEITYLKMRLDRMEYESQQRQPASETAPNPSHVSNKTINQ